MTHPDAGQECLPASPHTQRLCRRGVPARPPAVLVSQISSCRGGGGGGGGGGTHRGLRRSHAIVANFWHVRRHPCAIWVYVGAGTTAGQEGDFRHPQALHIL